MEISLPFDLIIADHWPFILAGLAIVYLILRLTIIGIKKLFTKRGIKMRKETIIKALRMRIEQVKEEHNAIDSQEKAELDKARDEYYLKQDEITKQFRDKKQELKDEYEELSSELK